MPILRRISIKIVETTKLTTILQSSDTLKIYLNNRTAPELFDFVVLGADEVLKAFALNPNRTASGDSFLLQYTDSSIFAQLIRASWQEDKLLLTFVPVSKSINRKRR